MVNNWAIAVGINNYEFLPNASLRFAGADALAMRRFLCEDAGFAAEKVLLCGDGTGESQRATRAHLRHILLNQLQHAQKADNLWFFFSGHGMAGTDRQDYLMTIDGNPQDLHDTAISINFVTDRLRACQAKNIVLILDMCRDESREEGRRSVESIDEASLRQLVKDREGQQGIITLFSCWRGQSSYEIAELEQGAFTYALLEGLKQHTILKDLEGYLERRVPQLHQIAGKVRKQVPLVISEPAWKYHEPILSHYGTAADVAHLQNMAIDAECDWDFERAIRLWKRVNLLAPDIPTRDRALKKILTLQTEVPAEKPTIPLEPTPKTDSPPTYTFQTVTLDKQGKVAKKSTGTATYIPFDLGNDISLEMTYIKPGSFTMGSEDGDSDEQPSHLVKVPGFYMGRYAITQEQYLAVMGKNPAKFHGAKLPVECVSWDDAVEFCQKLSSTTQQKFRLPSEAEWEYAARAGTTTPFHFGETITTDVANFDGNYTYGDASKGKYLEKTAPVGAYGVANDFGLYDMHGNVWEWCLDTWHENYQGAPVDGSAWIDVKNDTRLLRGGSWDDYPHNCRSANRLRRSAVSRSNIIGFRVVIPQDS